MTAVVTATAPTLDEASAALAGMPEQVPFPRGSVRTRWVDLVHALGVASAAVQPKKPLQLRCVNLWARHGVGFIGAFDFETGVQVRLSGTGEGTGVGAVEHAHLLESVKALGKGHSRAALRTLIVEVRWNGPVVEVEMDGTVVPLVRSGAPYDPARLPQWAAEEHVLPFASFADAALRAVVSADRDRFAQEAFRSVCLTLGGGSVEMVSTDRYRLTRIVLETVSDGATSKPAAVAWKPLQTLMRAMGKMCGGEMVAVGVRDGWLMLSTGSVRACLRLVTTEYPKTSSVFPTRASAAGSIIVGRAPLETSLARVESLLRAAGRRAAPAVLRVGNGGLTAVPARDDEGHSTSMPPIPVEVNGDLEGFEVAVNARFLLDALKVVTSPTVEIVMTTPSRPVMVLPTVEGDNTSYVLMTIRYSS